MGFMFNFIPHVLIVALYGPDLYGECDPWFYIFVGVSFFLYMVCDNCDGKQARRLGTSSPLGMLLDHGIDSVTAVINNFILQRVLMSGNNINGMFAMIISTMPFYFAVIEQYYTGELILQVVNGVDDGSIAYIAMCFATAYFGANTWIQEVELFGSKHTITQVVIYILMVALSLCTLDK